jgi:hypothetical protein
MTDLFDTERQLPGNGGFPKQPLMSLPNLSEDFKHPDKVFADWEKPAGASDAPLPSPGKATVFVASRSIFFLFCANL